MDGQVVESWNLEDYPGPWAFRVRLFKDTDVRDPKEKGEVYDPFEAETLDQEMYRRQVVRDWHQGHWCFVTVEVTPVRLLSRDRRVELEQASVSLGLVEWGLFPEAPQGREQINAYPVPELIRQCMEALEDDARQLAKSLNGILPT